MRAQNRGREHQVQAEIDLGVDPLLRPSALDLGKVTRPHGAAFGCAVLCSERRSFRWGIPTSGTFRDLTATSIRPPGEISMTLDEVDTPALVVDLDGFEPNLRRLPARIAGHRRQDASASQDLQVSGHRIEAGRARRRRRVRAEDQRG
jgi:hypothetical protein